MSKIIDKLKSLNGWNRLFVFVSLLWLIIVILIGFKNYHEFLSDEEINEYLPSQYQTPPFDPNKYLESVKKKESGKYGDWEPVPGTEVPQEDIPKPIPPEIYNQAYEKARFHELKDDVLSCLGYFFYPLFVLYSICWMIGWVIRGFRKKN